MSLLQTKFPTGTKILDNVERRTKHTVAAGGLCARGFNIHKNAMNI